MLDKPFVCRTIAFRTSLSNLLKWIFRSIATPRASTTTLSLRPHPEGRSGASLGLDGDELDLVSIALDGAPLAAAAYVATPDELDHRRIRRAARSLLRIETRIDPTANTKLMGLYRSGSAYCTQCEAEGFRRITYFLDRPDVLSVYRVRLEADKAEAPVLLANGNLEATGEAGPGRHFAIWSDPFKKPCYLFAVVAGDLAGVATNSPPSRAGASSSASMSSRAGRRARPMRWTR